MSRARAGEAAALARSVAPRAATFRTVSTPIELVAAFAEHLRPAGLDLVAPFSVRDYGARVPARYRLPLFGRDDALGVVVGNTRALWEPFVASLASEPRGLRSLHPLDRYVERAVNASLASLGARHQVRWAHARLSRLVAIQRAAYVAGLAFDAPCRLAIHPRHGLWIGLRAAIAFDLAPAFGAPGSTEPPAPHPCDGCATRPCVPAFEGALAATGGRRGCDVSPWQAVRDACPLAPHARYDDPEIRYHYTKDRAVLRVAAATQACSTKVR